MTRPITGLLLAGGQSRRFGRDKALVRWRGKTLAGHVHDALAAVADSVLVSVGAQGGEGLPAAPRVADRFPGGGPLAGLEAGLDAARTDLLLVAACDMPGLTAAALRTLVGAWTDEVDVVVAVDGEGRRHPLCGVYHRRLHARIAERLRRGERAVHRLLAEAIVREVRLPDEVLRNVNTPADLPADEEAPT